MTLHTYRRFVCPSGHQGEEHQKENDQPYGQFWESVTTEGMTSAGVDAKGYGAYTCANCGQPMTLVRS
jgi:hypothetical protein